MKKILIVYGTRPEAIKFAPLIVLLKRMSNLTTLILNTGQHKELLHGIWDIWDIKDDVVGENLDFQGDLSSNFVRVSETIQRALKDFKPNLIIVQGDTYSALAGSLMGFLNQVPVAHVEAGLRSGNPESPWPEELSRIAIDNLASIRFAPTDVSFKEIKALHGKNYLTGNTIVDSVYQVQEYLNSNNFFLTSFYEKYNLDPDAKFILFTHHRRESFNGKLRMIFHSIKQFAERGNLVYFPVHLNPNVRNAAFEILGESAYIKLLPPLDYLEMSILLQKCTFVVTDSGGLQEEAPSYRKKVFITRENTERPEVVSSGWGMLVGGSADFLMTDTYQNFLYKQASQDHPFGKVGVSLKISKLLNDFLEEIR